MNISDARDAILAVFKTAWDTTEFEVRYPDVRGTVPQTAEGPVDAPWARVGVTHLDAGQASLAGDQGQRRWKREGFFWAQIFCPVGDGGTKADELTQLVVNAFQDERSGDGVWYRKPRFREVPSKNAAFTQVNVMCDFIYDDVR